MMMARNSLLLKLIEDWILSDLFLQYEAEEQYENDELVIRLRTCGRASGNDTN